MRIFKRETAAFWVDIYFFGSRAADSFNPELIPSVLRWSRIGPTQVQILTTNHRQVESAAKEHERVQLEAIREERVNHLAALAESDALSKSSSKQSMGGLDDLRASSVDASSSPKKKPCRGCGKKR